MNNQPTSNRIFTFYGNLGGDPERRTIAEKEVTRFVYDPITDGPIEKTWTRPEINFLTFSIATGGYDDVPLVWHNCVDWEGLAVRARKGDQVEIEGYFEDRTFIDKKTGYPKTVRQIVVQKFRILKMKTRHEAD
jgi:single-stranded DNA-binding protein